MFRTGYLVCWALISILICPRHLACDFEGRAILSGVIKLALLMINNDYITKSRARITYLFYVFCFIFSL